jgi:hypothetical protein
MESVGVYWVERLAGIAINKKLTRHAEVVLINVVNSIILTRNLNVSNSFLDKNSHNFLLDYGIQLKFFQEV